MILNLKSRQRWDLENPSDAPMKPLKPLSQSVLEDILHHAEFPKIRNIILNINFDMIKRF